METDNTRRDFLRGGTLPTAGPIAGAVNDDEHDRHEHQHGATVGGFQDRAELLPCQLEDGAADEEGSR